MGYLIPFVEALLSLITVLVSFSTGCAALREASLIPILIPLLKDLDPEHTRLVGVAIHIFQAFMDYSNSATTFFRDLGGLDDIVVRLKLEMVHVEVGSQLHGAESNVATKGKALVVEEDMELQQASTGGHQTPLFHTLKGSFSKLCFVPLP